MEESSPEQQLWIELPPIEGSTPKRLIFFLHGAVSRPESFAPVAIAWQLKFPSATAIVLQAPLLSANPDLSVNPDISIRRYHWFNANAKQSDIRAVAQHLHTTIKEIQRANNIDHSQSIVVGFSQGATIALELSRITESPPVAEIIVAYAGQLNGAILATETIQTKAIHLVQGELDTVVTKDKALRAYEQLKRTNAQVTLDVLEDAAHGIDQDGIIVGTTRAMQSVFKGRRKSSLRASSSATLH